MANCKKCHYPIDSGLVVVNGDNYHDECLPIELKNDAHNDIGKNPDIDPGAFLKAAANGSYAIVKKLLDEGMDANIHDDHRMNALMISSAFGNEDIVTLLLNRNAKVNRQSIEGATALLLAAEKGHTNIVRMLLQKGADPYMRDVDGRNALTYAEIKGYIEIINLLRGAEVISTCDISNDPDSTMNSPEKNVRVNYEKCSRCGQVIKSSDHYCNYCGVIRWNHMWGNFGFGFAIAAIGLLIDLSDKKAGDVDGVLDIVGLVIMMVGAYIVFRTINTVIASDDERVRKASPYEGTINVSCKKCGYPIDANRVTIGNDAYHKQCVPEIINQTAQELNLT